MFSSNSYLCNCHFHLHIRVTSAFEYVTVHLHRCNTLTYNLGWHNTLTQLTFAQGPLRIQWEIIKNKLCQTYLISITPEHLETATNWKLHIITVHAWSVACTIQCCYLQQVFPAKLVYKNILCQKTCFFSAFNTETFLSVLLYLWVHITVRYGPQVQNKHINSISSITLI